MFPCACKFCNDPCVSDTRNDYCPDCLIAIDSMKPCHEAEAVTEGETA